MQRPFVVGGERDQNWLGSFDTYTTQVDGEPEKMCILVSFMGGVHPSDFFQVDMSTKLFCLARAGAFKHFLTSIFAGR